MFDLPLQLDLSVRLIVAAALGLAPTDARVHLAIARSHLAMGMRGRVVRELVQLVRLLELIGDEDGRARVVRFVNADLMHRRPSLDTI